MVVSIEGSNVPEDQVAPGPCGYLLASVLSLWENDGLLTTMV